MITYIGKRRPKDTPFSNRFELFNEAMTLVIGYHLLVFTDFFTDIEVRYNVCGNSFIYTSYVIIAANSALIIYQFLYKLRAYYRY